jgi:aspartyl-tRNA(Asn)/glutamyl-tRNA(Gln) amidotransferase subunit A
MAVDAMLPATIEQAAAALAAGQTTSRALVEACLERIAEPGGEGGSAFITIYEDRARRSADAMDALHAAGREPGRYAGIPVSIKDLFDVAGEVTLAGSTVLRGHPPALENSAAVQRLLAAGMVIVGRTNMTEFAFSGVGINPHYGTPRSPFDRASRRISGGSSSGAAVSVSDRMALAAVGTDTGGSCRIPAALCGIVGFKPTASRVSPAGTLPLAPSLDSVGPLANSVRCCAIMDAILSGDRIPNETSSTVAGLRFLIPTNFGFADIDAATSAAMDRVVSLLVKAGASVGTRAVASFDAIMQAHARGGMAATEAFAWHRELLATRAAEYDPRVANRIIPGGDMLAADYVALSQARRRIQAQFAGEIAGVDAIMLPTVPIAPPRIAEFVSDDSYWRLNYLLLRNPSVINFLDGCAISLPCHERGAPPAGLMIACGHMEDARLLRVAAAVERALAVMR